VEPSALAFAEFRRIAADQIVLVVYFVLRVDVKLVIGLLSTVASTLRGHWVHLVFALHVILIGSL
jgi:hypothetical protein